MIKTEGLEMTKLFGAILALGIFLSVLVHQFIIKNEEIPIADIRNYTFSEEQIVEGEMLAAVGACVVCHTSENGEEYAGGLALPTPFGTIYSTNITPDTSTGIGTWSIDAFRRSMKEGLDREGNHLYPAFPYDHFVKAKDSDIDAIYAYLSTLTPVSNQIPKNELQFPFNVRELLAFWKILFLDDTLIEGDPDLNEEENRGSYLANSLGHCGACHSPRNYFGAVIKNKPYFGGVAEGWDVPALGKQSVAPVKWTFEQYEKYMFDGWDENHGIAAGPMTAIVDHLYDASEDDVYAIVAWLASLDRSNSNATVSTSIVEKYGKRDWNENEQPGDLNPEGHRLFGEKCAKCHKQRIASSQPVSLGLTYSVNAPTAKNLINVIKRGINPPYAVSRRKMEAIEVTDAELEAIVEYVRARFTDLPKWENVESEIKEAKKNH